MNKEIYTCSGIRKIFCGPEDCSEDITADEDTVTQYQPSGKPSGDTSGKPSSDRWKREWSSDLLPH